MSAVRVGVVGLGKMGRHHVRCLERVEGAVLAGVMDVSAARGAEAPGGVFFTTELQRLLERCDAVVVAAPSDRHEEIGLACLAAKRHLLVEKTHAPTAAACRRLAQAAREADLVLAFGHVERWNGAVLAVAERVRSPRFVETDRLAGFDPRGTEVDVVLDLMIHDLDLVLRFVGEMPSSVDAVGVPIASERIDLASVRLAFPSGAVANLTASRVSRTPARKLRIFQVDSYFSLDLGAGTAEILRRDASAVPFGVTQERVASPAEHNPLVEELRAFIAAVHGAPESIAGAGEGTRAVEVAESILASIEVRRGAWDLVSGTRGAWDEPYSS